MKKLLAVLIVTAAFCSCSSVNKDLKNPDLTPEEFFQKAQEQVINWNRYNAALKYYNEFLIRYPNMKEKVIEAEYEIAFIKYKQHKYTEAEELFLQLLDKYQTDEAIYYPDWPRTISNKILIDIEKEKDKKGLKKIFSHDLGGTDQTINAEERLEKEERKKERQEAKEAKRDAKEAKRAAKKAEKEANQEN